MQRNRVFTLILMVPLATVVLALAVDAFVSDLLELELSGSGITSVFVLLMAAAAASVIYFKHLRAHQLIEEPKGAEVRTWRLCVWVGSAFALGASASAVAGWPPAADSDVWHATMSWVWTFSFLAFFGMAVTALLYRADLMEPPYHRRVSAYVSLIFVPVAVPVVLPWTDTSLDRRVAGAIMVGCACAAVMLFAVDKITGAPALVHGWRNAVTERREPAALDAWPE